MTDPTLEREAIALFERWLDIPEPERAGWLAERTAGQPELRTRVEAMAEADRRSQLRTGAAVDQVEEAPPPERIGAYRIVERIGRGAWARSTAVSASPATFNTPSRSRSSSQACCRRR